MVQQENTIVRKEKILTRKLIIGFKRKWWIILVAMVIGIIGGYAYSRTIKPSYTVTEKVIFTANVKTKEDSGSPYSASATQAYVGTVVDFINEGVVLSRASLYYDYYIKHEFADVSEIIELINTKEIDTRPDFDPTKKVPITFNAGNIKVSSSSGTDFTIRISLTGGDKEVIQDKVRILVAAAEREAQETETVIVEGEEYTINKYFGVEIKLGDYGKFSLVSNTSNLKFIVVAAIIGIVVGAAIVVLISVLDKKVKDREELELITDTNVLAYIDLQ